jgi:hypothetical protein
MSAARTMKWVTGFMEAFLGIPIIGGLFIISLSWAPLIIMFILHIVTLVLSNQNREQSYGSICGIITSVLGWIPFLGMLMHIITAIVLFISANRSSRSAY